MLDFSSPDPSRSPATHRNLSVDRIPPVWFALCIGNTRSHWAYIEQCHICALWEAPHLTPQELNGDIWHDLQHRSQQYRRTHPPQAIPRFEATDSPNLTNSGHLSQAKPLATATGSDPNDSSYTRTQPTRDLNDQPSDAALPIPIVIASVVPSQTQLWQTWLDSTAYPYRILSLADIPLAGLYPTLGIDRALAGLGVGQRLGFPCLTIDGGTALTFTGFAAIGSARSSFTPTEEDVRDPISAPGTLALGTLIGGAILPGMGLQYRSLGQETAQLSAVRSSFEARAALRPFPSTRWARDTLGAIDSGIHRAIGAIAWDFITDWRRRYPAAIVAITGGDATAIEVAIQHHIRDRDGCPRNDYERLMVVPEAITWGMIAALEAIALTPHSPDLDGESE